MNIPHITKIIENKTETKDIKTLTFRYSGNIDLGQFFMIWVPGVDEIPMGVSYIREGVKGITFRKVGDATTALYNLKAGDKIGVRCPCGNGFKINGRHILFVGGGTGVAPMLILGRYLREKHSVESQFLLGYRSSNLIIEQNKFESLGKVYLTTEDGSAGYKGFVIDHPVLHEDYPGFDMIYTCGPEIMMKAVASYAGDKNIPCEVSLENLMGCGIGACLCCIVDTVDKGNVNTCTEGPIFNVSRLKWLI